jgi:hypothetical protein
MRTGCSYFAISFVHGMCFNMINRFCIADPVTDMRPVVHFPLWQAKSGSCRTMGFHQSMTNLLINQIFAKSLLTPWPALQLRNRNS